MYDCSLDPPRTTRERRTAWENSSSDGTVTRASFDCCSSCARFSTVGNRFEMIISPFGDRMNRQRRLHIACYQSNNFETVRNLNYVHGVCVCVCVYEERERESERDIRARTNRIDAP